MHCSTYAEYSSADAINEAPSISFPIFPIGILFPKRHCHDHETAPNRGTPWCVCPRELEVQPVLASRNRCDSFREIFWLEVWQRMELTGGQERSGRCKPRGFCGIAMFFIGLVLVATVLPARAVELSAPQAALYSTGSIFPPSAQRMTVCYSFGCRRREMLDFTPGDRSALTRIMAAGRASAAAERAAVQKAVIWFDRRMGPVIGTNKRVAKANILALDDKHNYDCWDTTRNTTSLLLVLQQWGLFKYHVVGDPHYRGNVLVLQTPHNTAVLVERATRVEWVVDMWPRGYLQPPDVMPVEKWVTED